MTPDQQSRLDTIHAIQVEAREMSEYALAYNAVATALRMALDLIAELEGGAS